MRSRFAGRLIYPCCHTCRLQAATGPSSQAEAVAGTAAGDGPPRQQQAEVPDVVTCPLCGVFVALADIESHEVAHDLDMQQQVA